MHITHLHLENFRCYKKLDLDFDKRLTVIVGENGKGKTAVFDALRLALAPAVEKFGFTSQALSPKDVRREPVYDENGKHLVAMQACYPVTIATEIKFAEDKEYQSKLIATENKIEHEENLSVLAENLFKSLEANVAQLPVLAYYGTARLWVDSDLFSTQENKGRLLGYEEALQPSSSFNTFSQWFAQNAEKETENVAKQTVIAAVDTCMGSTGLKNLHYNEKMHSLVMEHDEFGELLYDDLSDGTRSVISMVADLAYRMVKLNPQLQDRALTETEGLVFIDEVDMHLHPLWQQTILYDLLAAFPKVQFLVTTHSPQVLSTVPAACIRAIAWEAGEIVVRKINFSLGAEISQILEDIQRVGTRPDFLPIVQDLHKYLDLVREGKWSTEEAKSLRKKLDHWSQGNEPLLLRADMDIRLQSLRSKRK